MSPLFEVIDASGGGVCLLRDDGIIEAGSRGFALLSGEANPAGRDPVELMVGMGPAEALSGEVGAETAVFRQIGSDGVGRELSAARLAVDDRVFVVLVDRSSEGRYRRQKAQLGRQIDDLRAELSARARAPKRSRVRTMRELAARIDETLARGRRYQHPVTVLATRCKSTSKTDLGRLLLGCIRGVDDLGQVADDDFVILLPHTPIAGGKIVADRIVERLEAADLTGVSVGVAQAKTDEKPDKLVARAEGACGQGFEAGGGVRLAVDVV